MLDSITLVGNLTKDPDLRITPGGDAVVTLRLATTPRRYDRTSASYVDGPTTYIDATAWRGLAENAALSLRRGARVVVVGRLHQRAWTTKDGQERLTTEIDAEVVATDLTFHSAMPAKVQRPSRERSEAAGGADAVPGAPVDPDWQQPGPDSAPSDEQAEELGRHPDGDQPAAGYDDPGAGLGEGDGGWRPDAAAPALAHAG